MAWIKRNLFFVIGGVIALALMGFAVWYLLTNWNVSREKQDKLEAIYSQLQTLTESKESPGIEGGKIDNQKIAEAQIKQLAGDIPKLRTHFVSISRIPPSANLTGREFGTALPNIIHNLSTAAAAASVALPPQYSFSFQAEMPLATFAAGSLKPLAVQLGEVKAICEVLFAAKINLLASVRREKVSTDDEAGTLADYLDEKSVVTDMATITPYEVTFHCFGAELATVLAGFEKSPYCFIVRSLAVEPAVETAMNTWIMRMAL